MKNTAATAMIIAVIAGTLTAAAGCGKTGHGTGAAARASSVMAGPAASADVTAAKRLVAKCIPGTPVQQLHTLHLLAASRTGKNAQAGEQTRARVYGCLGIPADQRASFENAALTSAGHGHLSTAAGRETYFEVTLPRLVTAYQARS